MRHDFLTHQDGTLSLARKQSRAEQRQARDHEPTAFLLLRSIPGAGPILALTILYEIHTIDRFPRVKDFSSCCRLVKPEHSSAGKRTGSGGARIGNAHLEWAFSERNRVIPDSVLRAPVAIPWVRHVRQRTR